MKFVKITILLCCGIMLGSPSGNFNNIMLGHLYAQTDVTITYLQNDGVLISDGTNKILIDAIANPSGWISLNATEASKLNNAQTPYNDIDLILITHNHSDHYSTSAVNTHLSSNANTKLIAPPPVAANFSGSQIVNSSPARGESETLTVNGIEVEVLHLRHFDAFGNDFSGVQNFGYLVKIGGANILHLGDVDMTVENFQNFGLVEKGIDVVLIPTFNAPAHFLTSHRDALNSEIQPAHIIGLHLLPQSIATITQQVNNLYPGATVFTTPLQSFTLNVTSVEDEVQAPESFSLGQNYPNPFNPTTIIEYELPRDSQVVLQIYNLLGQGIRILLNNSKPTGMHSVVWDGKNDLGQIVSSGVYIYRIQVGSFTQTRKMIFLQ